MDSGILTLVLTDGTRLDFENVSRGDAYHLISWIDKDERNPQTPTCSPTTTQYGYIFGVNADVVVLGTWKKNEYPYSLFENYEVGYPE